MERNSFEQLSALNRGLAFWKKVTRWIGGILTIPAIIIQFGPFLGMASASAATETFLGNWSPPIAGFALFLLAISAILGVIYRRTVEATITAINEAPKETKQ